MTAHGREAAVRDFLTAFDERESLIVRVKTIDSVAYMAADERLTTARAALARYLAPDALDVEALADMAVMSLGEVTSQVVFGDTHERFRARFTARLERAAEYARLRSRE